jgi:2-keto-4-pentenoate hydratase/2-oxohepta-3-ene-1,7-dioic acid hydratase in catechol pathway
VKLLFIEDFRLCVLRDPEHAVDVSAAVADIPHTGPHELINGLIARFEAYRGRLEQAAAQDAPIPLAGKRIRPPLPKPGNIVCMAVNYMEDGTLPAPAPINAFHKAASAVIGPGDAMVLPDVPATIFEGEAELAVVIGRRTSHVPAAQAMDHVFGYMNFIDGSARGLKPANNSFFQMKSRETFAPIGPWIVTRDEISNPQDLRVRLSNNGMPMQDFSTSDMAHDIARCIEWVSSIHTLEPGDILATGTNHRGLNAFMDGDRIALEVEGCGRLEFSVHDALKRTWSRETRLDRQRQGHDTPTPQIGGKYAPAA